MIFEKLLVPDEMYDTFRDITPAHLTALGIRFIFSDIDNTLATYDDKVAPQEVIDWYRDMHDAGITVVLVSNNGRKRVETFGASLGCTVYYESKKPSLRVLRRAMADAGASAENSVLLGDQLLTDAAAGRRAGMHVIIVPPIKDKSTQFFRFKRWLEKPYLRKFNLINRQNKREE